VQLLKSGVRCNAERQNCNDYSVRIFQRQLCALQILRCSRHGTQIHPCLCRDAACAGIDQAERHNAAAAAAGLREALHLLCTTALCACAVRIRQTERLRQ